MNKLKDFVHTGEFGIIDQHTHQYKETLPYQEAVEKYGERDVYGSYTAGWSELPNGCGEGPSFKTDVWIMTEGE